MFYISSQAFSQLPHVGSFPRIVLLFRHNFPGHEATPPSGLGLEALSPASCKKSALCNDKTMDDKITPHFACYLTAANRSDCTSAASQRTFRSCRGSVRLGDQQPR